MIRRFLSATCSLGANGHLIRASQLKVLESQRASLGRRQPIKLDLRRSWNLRDQTTPDQMIDGCAKNSSRMNRRVRLFFRGGFTLANSSNKRGGGCSSAIVIAMLALYPFSHARAGTVTYIYADQQETILAEADSNGNIIASFDNRPYGSSYVGGGMSSGEDGPGYAGHVNDTDTQLVYMQARYYDPAVGRFVSVDPLGPSSGQIFNFSRFAYANNNPVVNTDPDGRCTGSVFCETSLASAPGVVGHGYTSQVSPASPTSRPSKNMVNPSVAAAAMKEANAALKTVQQSATNQDQLAKIWGAAVQPVADKYDTEIASKFFLTSGGYRFGLAVSDGVICAQSAICSVNVYTAPGVPGGVLTGFAHTHPNNLGLSGSDLYVAYNLWRTNALLNPVAVYATQPDGRIRRWSTDQIQHASGKSYDDIARKDTTYVQ